MYDSAHKKSDPSMIASLQRRICLTRFIFSGSAKTDGQLAGSGQEAMVLKTFNQLLDWLRHGGGARTKAPRIPMRKEK